MDRSDRITLSIVGMLMAIFNKPMKTARYSATPLAKKLGIKDGFVIRLSGPPAYYFDLFEDMPLNIKIFDEREPAKKPYSLFRQESARAAQGHAAIRGKNPDQRHDMDLMAQEGIRLPLID